MKLHECTNHKYTQSHNETNKGLSLQCKELSPLHASPPATISLTLCFHNGDREPGIDYTHVCNFPISQGNFTIANSRQATASLTSASSQRTRHCVLRLTQEASRVKGQSKVSQLQARGCSTLMYTFKNYTAKGLKWRLNYTGYGIMVSQSQDIFRPIPEFIRSIFPSNRY
jgi:hypothetical protein